MPSGYIQYKYMPGGYASETSTYLSRFRIDWSYDNITVTNGVATVNLNLSCSFRIPDAWGASVSYMPYKRFLAVDNEVIAGSKDTDASCSFTLGEWNTVLTGTKTITYDAASAKTVYLSGGVDRQSTSGSIAHWMFYIGIPANTWGKYYCYPYTEGIVTPEYASNTTDDGAITFPVQATACTAPTSYSVSHSIISSATSFTISWSGAKSGISNPIAGYMLWWRYSDINGNKTDWSRTYVTSTSYTATYPYASSYRGGSLDIQIHTKDTLVISGSPKYEKNGVVRFNRLPDVPTTSSTSWTYASTSSGIHPSVTKGSDSDGQSTSLYYEKAGGSRYAYASSTILSAGTYYFYTYDGMEYSGPTTVYVYKNNKPTVASSQLPSMAASVITENITNFTRTDTVFANTINITYPSSTSGMTYTLVYQTYNNNAAPNNSSWKTVKTLSKSNGNFNVFTNISGNLRSNGIYYAIACVYNDGIENSDVYYHALSSGNKYMAIAPFGGLSYYRNNHSTGNVSESQSTHFYQKVRFALERDDSLNASSYYFSASANSIGASSISVSGTNPINVDMTFPSNLSAGTDYTILLTVTSKTNSSVAKNYSTVMKQVPMPNTAILQTSNISYSNCYTLSETTGLNYGITNSSGYTAEANYKSAYSLGSDWLSLGLSFSGSYVWFDSSTLTFSNNQIYRSIPYNETYYNKIAAYCSNKLGNNSAIMVAKIKNVFGKETIITTNTAGNLVNVYFNFAEDNSIALSNTVVRYKLGNSYYNAIAGAYKICEGLFLNLKFDLSTYHPIIKNGIPYVNYEIRGSNLGTIYSASIQINTSGAVSYNNPCNYSLSTYPDTKKIPQILEIGNTTEEITFIFTDAQGAIAEYGPINFTRVAFEPLEVSITNGVYTADTENVILDYNITKLGYDPNLGTLNSDMFELVLNYITPDGENRNTDNISYNSFISETYTHNIGSLYTYVQYKFVGKTRLTVDLGYVLFTTSPKDIICNVFTLYASQPTVSLRKGYLGINNTTINENAIVQISAVSGREILLFTSADLGEHPIKIFLSALDKREAGEIDGVIINGGEW